MGNFLQGPGSAAAAPTVSTLYGAALPVGIPSSGSIGNNGALTGLTAFATTYPNIYLFFPAGAIAAGSAAGFYFCQMSSATAGTIFNNALVTGTAPAIPAAPTPFVTTGPGAYTQSTSLQVLSKPTIKGGTLGINSMFEIYTLTSMRGAGGNKTFAFLFGGSSVGTFVSSSGAGFQNITWLWNQGQANQQAVIVGGAVPGFGVVGAPTRLSVNTANDFTFEVDGTLASAADWMVLEALTLRMSG